MIEKEIFKYHLLSCFTMNIMFKFELAGEAHQFKLGSQPNKKRLYLETIRQNNYDQQKRGHIHNLYRTANTFTFTWSLMTCL